MHYQKWQWRGLGVLTVGLALAFPAHAEKLQKVSGAGPEQKQADLTKRYFPSLRPEPGVRAAAPLSGQTKAPKQAAPEPDRIGDIYIVAKGDTLAGVAARSGVSVQQLARVNGMSTRERLRDGQLLCIPMQVHADTAPTDWDDKNQSFVDTAMLYRGVPYRWAGMSSRGVDCSGLVSLVLKSHGVEAPHNAARLYNLGTSVLFDDLQSGDLVFFASRGKAVGHVGIYIGDAKFIHASSRSGRVTVNSLSEKYYKQHYVGAKRVEW
jgi:cell wall-associated NlpC family hydrolase